MALHARKTIVIGAASVALAAAGILPFYAFAAPNPRATHPSAAHRRFGIERLGTISSINGSSVTLTTKKGVLYTVDAQHAKIMKDGVSASLAAVAVGDPIAVIGHAKGDNITARVVFDGPRVREERRGLIIGGTVTTVAPGEFVLAPKGHHNRPARPAVTVDTNADTVITRAGQVVPSDTLSAGSEVIVSGTRETNSALIASKVIIRKR